MAAEREAGAPILRAGGDQSAAAIFESLRMSELLVETLEPVERKIGAIRRSRDQSVPGLLGASQITALIEKLNAK